jgi:succinylglutamate desuccinylase
MGAVGQMATELSILDALPDGFLDCGASDLHLLFDGPTLIDLPGEREPPLFVSVLLHGNEDSGLGAVQRVLRGLRGGPLPRSLLLLIGNVEAARRGLRRLETQPDYNRIWPGTPDHADTPEAGVMAQVHARAIDRRAVAAIDFHNNSGRNPHYAVVCSLDPATLGIAALFSRRAVCFRGVPGTQTASFTGLLPAVTAECGQAAEPANAAAGARFLSAALQSPDRVAEGAPPELYHTLGVVRVREDVSFAFGPGEAELRFDAALDENNFRETRPGLVVGETNHPMPLRMIDEAGRDIAEHYFETHDGRLQLRRPAVPAMFTTDANMVRQDCLGYLMERIGI